MWPVLCRAVGTGQLPELLHNADRIFAKRTRDKPVVRLCSAILYDGAGEGIVAPAGVEQGSYYRRVFFKRFDCIRHFHSECFNGQPLCRRFYR